jgi:hypothetical protein
VALSETGVSMLELGALIEGLSNGNIALPEFQRDFDWSEREIRSLLATIVRGWPAGSLLLMRGASDFFTLRAFEDSTLSSKIGLVVLDGQQRLTSLYRALFDVGPYVYAIQWKDLADGDIDSLEDAIVGTRRDRWDKSFRALEKQVTKECIPFYALKSPTDFFAWRDALLKKLPQKQRDNHSAELTDTYKNVLSRLNSYQFPAVILENTMEPDGVARIFERVNKMGLRLGAFDLVVARVYSDQWNLRDAWKKSTDLHPRIEAFFGDDGMPILQTIGLVHLSNVRQAAVLKLDPKIIQKRWTAAAAAVSEALEFLATQCGVVDPSWLPYRAIVLALAGLSFSNIDLIEHAKPLRQWFWSCCFNMRFEVASNTRVVSDFKELLVVTNGGGKLSPDAPSGATIVEATKKAQGAIWRATLCAIAAQNPRDLGGVKLGLSAVAASGTHAAVDTEIQSLFNEDGGKVRALGIVLSSKETARKLRSQSLGDVLKDAGKEPAAKALASQFLPAAKELIANADDPDAVLAERLQRLEVFFKKETGRGFAD